MTLLRLSFAAALACAASAALPASLAASGGSIIVQSTTSTQNSGFYRHIVPPFTAETGIEVRVVAVGTRRGGDGRRARHDALEAASASAPAPAPASASASAPASAP